MRRYRLVAVFDTAFHQTMPDVAKQYARSLLTWPSGIGSGAMAFMGLRMPRSANGCRGLYGESTGAGASGSPCSWAMAAPIAADLHSAGRSETSMGFTPLEGLVMGTRSGDVDASIVSYLSEREKVRAC